MTYPPDARKREAYRRLQREQPHLSRSDRFVLFLVRWSSWALALAGLLVLAAIAILIFQ